MEPAVASAPAPPNQATRKPAPIFRLPPKEVPEPVGPSLKVNMPEFTKRTLSGAMQRHFVRAIAQQNTESARMYLEHAGTAHLDCLTPDALLAMRLIAMDILLRSLAPDTGDRRKTHSHERAARQAAVHPN